MERNKPFYFKGAIMKSGMLIAVTLTTLLSFTGCNFFSKSNKTEEFLTYIKKVKIKNAADKEQVRKKITAYLDGDLSKLNTVTTKRGNTALHRAVKHGKPRVIALLIEMGANPSVKNKKGKTPLAKAKRHLKRYKQIVETLEKASKKK